MCASTSSVSILLYLYIHRKHCSSPVGACAKIKTTFYRLLHGIHCVLVMNFFRKCRLSIKSVSRGKKQQHKQFARDSIKGTMKAETVKREADLINTYQERREAGGRGSNSNGGHEFLRYKEEGQ